MSRELSSTTVSRDYVENILKSIADALIVCDANGNITELNKSAEAMLGYDAGELIGTTVGRIIGGGSLAEVLTPASPDAANSARAETRFQRKDGGSLPVEVSMATLSDIENAPTGTVYIAQDISERLRSQQAIATKNEELARTNKELDQFAYVVSHDLKAPLRAISNLAEWIEEDLEGKIDDDIRKQLDLLRGRVNRMDSLINGVLEYSRIGRVAIDTNEFDVRELLDEVVDSMPVPEGCVIDIGDNMPHLSAPRVHLSQVFANLVSNAIKYCGREDGHVDISVSDGGDSYEFAVKDNGPGIAPEFHEKVFGIFQTLEARDKVESTGVGLTLVKKIVEECGGRIVVESDGENGTTFKFTWLKQLTERQAA